MSHALVVSPFLRPFLDRGRLVIDDCATGTMHRLRGLEERLLRALWPPQTSPDELDGLVEQAGFDAVTEAVTSLLERGLLAESVDEARARFRQLLESKCPPVPFVDQVELTNNCPMRCRYCPRGTPGGISRTTGFMSLGLFRNLLRQLPSAQSAYRPLELHHLGESLLHPQVDDFVREASQHGIATEMSVNPSLLTPALSARLVEAGIGRLVLSLDGMDEETLQGLRGPAAKFSAAESHINALLSHVAARPSPPRVVIQMLDLQRNRHQRDLLIERWGRTGLPSVSVLIKPLDGPDPDSGSRNTEPLTYLCTYPFRSVVVLWDGRVVPCCRDADAHYVLGNLEQETLAGLWSGEQARALRSTHLEQNASPGHLCAQCAWSPARFEAAMPRRHPDRAAVDPLQW